MKRLLQLLPLSVITLNAALVFSTPIFADPPNLTLVKKEVKHYHDSGLYEKELTKAIEQAHTFIIHQARINQQKRVQQKLAVVLDIDETSLSNYNSMVKLDFGGSREQFHQEIMAANAPAIQPMLALYHDALDHGIKVFFVTGRNESERAATEKNLIKAGYKQWSGLYLRPVKYSFKSITPFKAHARELISKQGYTIVATIGDQYSDLRGGYTEKGFKLPNPYYYLP